MSRSRIARFAQMTRQACTDSGRSPWSVWAEAWRLHRGAGRLGFAEYVDLGLAARSELSADDKAAFLGYAAYRWYERLNSRSSHALANDKVHFHATMQAAGLGLPNVQALFSPAGRRLGSAVSCRSVDELHHFLAHHARYPLFVKPADGVFGKGTHWLLGYDAVQRQLPRRSADALPLQAFVDGYGHHLRYGVLLQDVVDPHADMLDLCGPRVSSVRVLVLQTERGPELLCANWKVPSGDNIVDNTGGWSNGNLVAAVDADGGRLTALWRGEKGRPVPARRHPDTGVELVGRQLPLWREMRAYALDAAVQFPDLRLQGWDLVPAAGGVLAFEVNLVTESTVYANQLVHGRGLLDQRLRRALADLSR